MTTHPGVAAEVSKFMDYDGHCPRPSGNASEEFSQLSDLLKQIRQSLHKSANHHTNKTAKLDSIGDQLGEIAELVNQFGNELRTMAEVSEKYWLYRELTILLEYYSRILDQDLCGYRGLATVCAQRARSTVRNAMEAEVIPQVKLPPEYE